MSKKNPATRIEGPNLEIELEAISPVVYMLVTVGDLAQVIPQTVRKNEYRDKIPKVGEALLVFCGNTKVGMIPQDVVAQLGHNTLLGKCRISRMSKEQNVVAVRLRRSGATPQ